MNFIFKEITLFKRKIAITTIIWFALALAAVLAEVLRNQINNYLIFEGVFRHTWLQKPLYLEYPEEYFDSNHYGPLFSIIIMPFAWMPAWLGCIFWSLTNAWMLWFAIHQLNLGKNEKIIIIAISTIEMMTSTHNVQFNPSVAAWLIMAYVLVEKEKDFWAAMFIVAGFLVKIYGIAGCLFFLFSKQRINFILSFIFWMVVLVCLPMLISSKEFILQSYVDWYNKLVFKNQKNIHLSIQNGMQDISMLGIFRRSFNIPDMKNSLVTIPAAVLILAPLLRFKQYAAENFRFSYLAIVLISVVIFSSSAESATHVISVCGAAIWYVLHYKEEKRFSNAILILVLLLTSLSATDLFPSFVKEAFIKKYALKALPVCIVWLLLIKDVLIKDFTLQKTKTALHEAH